jgi:TolB protein
MRIRHAVAASLLTLTALPLGAQWTNRYPRLAGFGHHVYLEGYELPLLTQGPIDPAPSPDGKRVAFASRGWLWLFDIASGTATRLTKGGGVDSRPTWSPDGARLAFVRDDNHTLGIWLVEVASGAETRVVSDAAIVLDPAFSPDGRTLYYSSGIGGDLDLWKLDLASRATTRLTTTTGPNELQPMPTRDGTALVYLLKTRGGSDQIRRLTLATGEDKPLATGSIISMTRGSVHPDGRTMVLTWPSQEGYELRLASTLAPGATVEILRDPKVLPLVPSFSADGNTIWFSHADADQHMVLARVPTAGGAWQDVAIKRWDWGAPTAQLRVMTKLAGGVPTPARLAVTGAQAHPMVPDHGQVRFDGQNGIAFFYSDGVATLTVPAGDVEVTAVRGLATPPATERTTIKAGETKTITLTLAPVWNARANGWLSGDHHFHLNYGGPYNLEPGTLVNMGLAEDMDVLTPMLANLAQRFEDQPLFAYRHTGAKPWIIWAQEVRAHFFGHIGMLNTSALYWPWIWGPGYDVHQLDDRVNVEPLDWARTHGGMSTYVHPVSGEGPFTGAPHGIPTGFVADAVQGKIDAIELACLWSDERGTTDLWYRVLNAGIPMAITGGTDVMNNLYRTMAVGTTRVYVHPDKPSDVASYWSALKAGRSFVSTGPMLDFHVGKAGPGQAVPRGAGTATYTLDLHSAVTVDTVQIIVNGQVVATHGGLTAPGSGRYTGTVTLPVGGWVAARVVGAPTRAWPGMDSYAFAHTAPVWIDRVGSTEPAAKLAAARDLLRALDVADQGLATAYTGADHPKLLAHFAAARRVLDAWAKP